jgi:hypothetical protein
LLGVNLQNGSLSPVSLDVGNGGFPYELSASMLWHPSIMDWPKTGGRF